jgi:MFS family permease
MSSRSLGRNFHRLWAAAAVSNLGDGLRLVAFPLLAATITRDPGLVAGVTVALRLPWLLFSIPAGELADLVDRRKLMAFVSGIQAAVMALFGLALLAGGAQLPLLYVVAFFLGIGEVTFDTAAQTLIPATVDQQNLERANGRLIVTERIVNELIGPPVGSFLFAAVAAAPLSPTLSAIASRGLV